LKKTLNTFLAYFPKKESEAYEITSLSVCLSKMADVQTSEVDAKLAPFNVGP
jgi:hypothetical protein